jgi:hypothetical protein
VPTGRFIKYQTGTWLPWFVKRYIFWNKNAKLEPLYTFDRGIVEDMRQQRPGSVAAAAPEQVTTEQAKRDKRDDSS